LEITENQRKFVVERMFALFKKDMTPKERMVSVFPRIYNLAKILSRLTRKWCADIQRSCMYGDQKDCCILESLDLDLSEDYKKMVLSYSSRLGGFNNLNDIWNKETNDQMSMIRKLVKEENKLLVMYTGRQELLNEFEEISGKEMVNQYKLHFKDFLKRFKSAMRGEAPELSKEEMVYAV
jgi:hypothetical protein